MLFLFILGGTFAFQLLMHFLFLIVIGLLLFVSLDNPWNIPLLFSSYLLNGIAYAFLLCLGSTRQLSLGQPYKRVISMAFVTSMQNLGTFIGRTGATLVLGSGILASTWSSFNISFTNFHAMFAFCFTMAFIGLIFHLLAPADDSEVKD